MLIVVNELLMVSVHTTGESSTGGYRVYVGLDIDSGMCVCVYVYK